VPQHDRGNPAGGNATGLCASGVGECVDWSNGVRSRPWNTLVIALGLAAWAGSIGAAKSAAAPASAASAAKGRPAAKRPAPIDINSASRDQLKTLPGIGDAEAKRIIANRPYHSTADLAERGVIPTGVYIALKGRIIAKQKSNGKVGVP
jgi:competence protein ComEA